MATFGLNRTALRATQPIIFTIWWGAVKDKYYADKPEAINALKDNIREAIGEIQLHTIDNVLKNWTARVGYINRKD